MRLYFGICFLLFVSRTSIGRIGDGEDIWEIKFAKDADEVASLLL